LEGGEEGENLPQDYPGKGGRVFKKKGAMKKLKFIRLQREEIILEEKLPGHFVGKRGHHEKTFRAWPKKKRKQHWGVSERRRIKRREREEENISTNAPFVHKYQEPRKSQGVQESKMKERRKDQRQQS